MHTFSLRAGVSQAETARWSWTWTSRWTSNLVARPADHTRTWTVTRPTWLWGPLLWGSCTMRSAGVGGGVRIRRSRSRNESRNRNRSLFRWSRRALITTRWTLWPALVTRSWVRGGRCGAVYMLSCRPRQWDWEGRQQNLMMKPSEDAISPATSLTNFCVLTLPCNLGSSQWQDCLRLQHIVLW